jgi:hypothetical protein
MKAAQFFTGKINGFEDNYETSNLIDFLDIDKVDALKAYNITSKPYQRFFKAEKVIALVEAYSVTNGDEAGRSGVQARGVLYKYDKATIHDDLQYVFPDEQFIKELQLGKKLKMPPLPVLKKPLDSPPPLEWEV